MKAFKLGDILTNGEWVVKIVKIEEDYYRCNLTGHQRGYRDGDYWLSWTAKNLKDNGYILVKRKPSKDRRPSWF